MHSPGHRALILNPYMKTLGVGFAYGQFPLETAAHIHGPVAYDTLNLADYWWPPTSRYWTMHMSW